MQLPEHLLCLIAQVGTLAQGFDFTSGYILINSSIKMNATNGEQIISGEQLILQG